MYSAELILTLIAMALAGVIAWTVWSILEASVNLLAVVLWRWRTSITIPTPMACTTSLADTDIDTDGLHKTGADADGLPKAVADIDGLLNTLS